ncbi:putative ubiquitin carboxyl-terminal hydrolase [Rosellinia necatrix]|uniref:Putative ubiquitin carboxyl-terminal hydrolase n=1 Tax=Rosellinia necatrix TaxID=77044 RepID=A0A1W2TLU0_ROSNE|nr:putative ubiquitin carboxyl-terminal hydrolase [Rosellinia necatrix]
MDQDSRTDESRERALSSEPSSTRPNPFDDDSTPSARKRRRTSLSGSRSASVETALSTTLSASLSTTISHDNAIAASDPRDMKIDTQGPALPSTPPAPSEQPSEPVSSRVTINLRNAGSLEATPTSPASPTPSRQRPGHVRASVEAPEVDMAPTHSVDDTSSSSSTLDSPEPASIGVEGIEDDAQFFTIEPQPSFPRTVDLNSIMSEFPYRCEGELPHDGVTRLLNYFRQQPDNVDEALIPIHNWLTRCLTCARLEIRATIAEVYRENRVFWSVLPELFYQFGQRLNYTKAKNTRGYIAELLAQFAKLSAFLLNLDIRNLAQGVTTEESFTALVSPQYLRVLSALPHPDDLYLSNGAERNPNLLSPLEVFQSGHGVSLTAVISFIQSHIAALPRFPRIAMDNLVPSCMLVHSIVRESVQKQGYTAGLPQNILERSRNSLVLGYRCFTLLSSAVDTVIDKSINTLSQENATNITYYLSELLKHSLQGTHTEAIERVQQYRQDYPQVPSQYACEAIALEWRFQIYCKLIRSRQMQLRVSAAASMCDELVSQWKRYQDRQQEPIEDTQPYLDYLKYLSSYITRTGIVDYILGPTCHPEITTTSSNIIGFLGVTKTYTSAQTNLLWQTLTSTQDPRIAEALVKMMVKITLLFQPVDLLFFLDKFQHVPIDSFTLVMRELFDNITDLLAKPSIPPTAPTASFEVCVRLLRESSVFTAQGSIAYPDIYQFAQLKLKRLLVSGLSEEGRQDIALSCLSDVASRSETSSGSLQVLTIVAANHVALQTLIEEHNFIQLLVDDLEAAIQSAKSVGVTRVYSNPYCHARRKFISNIITQFGSAIDTPLGQRLWDSLVGDNTVSQDDRKIAWEDLCASLKRKRENRFLVDCVRLFLPNLSPSCYCNESLSFVRDVVVPTANDTNGIILDDEDSVKLSGIELLWQIILLAPNQDIANDAISTLVNEIYVNGSAILSYPLQRARKVHFSLVHRCLSQLKSAAQKLTVFNDGTTSNDDESMVIVVADDQHTEQELRFARTLKVLTTLSNTLRKKSNFAAPDLRSLMLTSPNAVNGELAGLKYQSFDGDEHTEMKPLRIGLKNSAASLLASLREATGFENYRLYYRGTTLAPSDADICKSLEDLNIKNGLILVKRELDLASSPVRIKPGASPLEIEILSHFNDLWEYLSMEETLAREMYEFLISLPADDSILAAFENPSTSPRDVFPLGQPFKSLYAIYALREHLHTRRLKNTMMYASSHEATNQQQFTNDRQDAVAKAISLIAAAICDPDVIDQCSNEGMRLKLGLQLVDAFVQLLKETIEPRLISQLLTIDLHERLITILTDGAKAESNDASVDLVHRCFEGLLECCTKSDEFWAIFRSHPMIGEVIQTLLLADERPSVRQNIAKLINTKSLYDGGRSSVLAIDFAELFWPIILQLLPQAASKPQKCEELFNLASHLTKKLIENGSSTLDLPSCVKRCGDLLLSHTSTEDLAHPEVVDKVAYGLISLLRQGIEQMSPLMRSTELPAFFPKRLFSKHLFPPENEAGPLVPHAILHSSSRHMLYEIIYTLAGSNQSQMVAVLQNLNLLTAHQVDDTGMDSYKYELPQAFDRTNAIRSICGYSGLRNLSNTCYLNSLFTQLFMNIGFRQFMLNARIDKPHAQQLLSETQILFANLQDSRRRFIDPQACIEQITTYEELPVDIHNQMDVDEFFNLLFDRWETQFIADSDKKELRSVYGGQLVQQVKSKECEHISERIEPFSAIQCDIKGKSGLEESLQAYVDGEIMEGDNKYKCSTCDRHVDAVKRACLKDLPDNLIFHLKRFDFNLRLLQRSKINDYFPFPNEIDMQPYTVEHLSDPSRNSEPDIFELVGVLVHSGTAETGHYYSFIRERPTNCGTAPWVEFNDDIVAPWDPSQMENACFGGQDHRQYDNGNIYEKVYSAYMLFYQRSSSLRQEQGALRINGNSRRLRTDVPLELELQVKLDNWAIIQRHNLYDPSHIPFVLKILEMTWSGKCSKEHKKENLAMHVALGHLDQVASRAKDLPDFDTLSGLIITACQRCSLCCFTFFQYFQQYKEAFRMLLFKNSDPAVRHDVGQTFLYVLKKIKTTYPEEYNYVGDEGDEASTSSSSRPTVLEETADLFLHIWDTFHTRPIAWPEYFGTMVDFAKLGRLEAVALLDRDFLAKVLMAIAADQAFDLPSQYSRLLAVVSRRMATRPPNYEGIIALADILMDCIDADMGNFVEPYAGRLSMAQQDDPIPFTTQEISILHKTWGRLDAGVFADKLIQLNQNPVATDSIINRLVIFNDQMDLTVLRSLLSGITGHITPHPVTPFLRAGFSYYTSCMNRENVHRLLRHVSEQCRTVQNAEARSFFEFQKDVFEGFRTTGESFEEIRLQSLRNLPLWIPGLLGYVDRTVSSLVESFMRERVFKYGTSPVFEETSGGHLRSQAMISVARELAVSILYYLRDTYVTRGAQASRDTMQPFHRVLHYCDAYFREHEELEDGMSQKYNELYSSVLEAMHNLTVDEIEDDGSDWEQSIGSSESFADLSSMQVDHELMEGNA